MTAGVGWRLRRGWRWWRGAHGAGGGRGRSAPGGGGGGTAPGGGGAGADGAGGGGGAHGGGGGRGCARHCGGCAPGRSWVVRPPRFVICSCFFFNDMELLHHLLHSLHTTSYRFIFISFHIYIIGAFESTIEERERMIERVFENSRPRTGEPHGSRTRDGEVVTARLWRARQRAVIAVFAHGRPPSVARARTPRRRAGGTHCMYRRSPSPCDRVYRCAL